MAKSADKQSEKQTKELQDAADNLKDVSADLVKLAQKIADSDEKTKQKLITQYQATLREVSDLLKQQNDAMKAIVKNIGN